MANFKPVSTGGGPSKSCSSKCKQIAVKKRKQNDARIGKAVRRARSKGAQCESVNPFKVFDRDNWVCQLCGIKTPKSKRASIDDDAPELDHIIPLSRGGSHSYINTQCACRRCNQSKGDKPSGQLLMFGL
jgi:5-methylcytosine-specific restriction endonuclease McrA